MSRLSCAVLLAGIAIFLAPGRSGSVGAQTAELVRVFVEAGDGASDFVEPGAKDSSDDVIKALRGRKGIAVVESVSESDVTIRVLRRIDSRGRQSATIATGPTTSIEVIGFAVVARMSVDSYSQELVGIHTRSWGASAGNLAQQVEKWIRENKARVLKRRAAPPGSAA